MDGEVMKIATSGSASLLGDKAADLGYVKPGYHADLIIVEGDPLSDPKAHARIRHVFKSGKIVDRKVLFATTQRAGCGKIF